MNSFLTEMKHSNELDNDLFIENSAGAICVSLQTTELHLLSGIIFTFTF